MKTKDCNDETSYSCLKTSFASSFSWSGGLLALVGLYFEHDAEAPYIWAPFGSTRPCPLSSLPFLLGLYTTVTSLQLCKVLRHNSIIPGISALQLLRDLKFLPRLSRTACTYVKAFQVGFCSPHFLQKTKSRLPMQSSPCPSTYAFMSLSKVNLNTSEWINESYDKVLDTLHQVDSV